MNNTIIYVDPSVCLLKCVMWLVGSVFIAGLAAATIAAVFAVGLVGSILIDIFLGGWIADWIDNNIK